MILKYFITLKLFIILQAPEDLTCVTCNIQGILLFDHVCNFWWGGGDVQQIQLRTEDGENGDLGAVAP